MATNFRFSKIDAGRVNTRGKHDLSHDVATSGDFGSVQPLFCKKVIGDSKIKVSFDSYVRVMPLAYPPFGKCVMKYYAQFVPFEKLLKSYKAFRAQYIYNSSKMSYIPSSLPYLPCAYTKTTGSPTLTLLSLFFSTRFCNWAAFSASDVTTGTLVTDRNRVSFTYDSTHPLSNSELSYSSINSALNFYNSGGGNYSDYSGLSVSSRVTDASVCNFYGLTPQGSDYIFEGTYQSTKFVVFIKLTQQGRQLRKVLNTLGIQINTQDSGPIDFMPIFSYYKAWYDIFYPQRDSQWEQTYCFKLLDYISENNVSDLSGLPAAIESSPGWPMLCVILRDIADAFASCDPNYFTSAITSMASSLPSSPSSTIFDSSDPSLLGNVSQSGDSVPRISLSGSLSRNSLRLLNSLSKFVNTNNVIGQSLKKFFSAHFGQSILWDEDSTYCGSGALDIQLGDVVINSNTSEGRAGDYAGVGYGKGGFNVSYSSKVDGCFLVLCSIIPVANYVQGTEYDIRCVKPLEIPQPEYDAIGYDKVKVSEILHQNTIFDNDHILSAQGESIFGYQPRYTGHKVKKSVFTGDFSLQSTRDTRIGFTLDNYISQDVVKSDSTTPTAVSVSIENPRGILLKGGVYWRWLGKYKWLNNFDRIFYDGEDMTTQQTNVLGENNGNVAVDDGFLIYSQVSCLYTTPLHSISQSYDTIEGGSNYQSHE